jgi:hypothetical protein
LVKAGFTIALVLLAGLGSGCDAVVGQLSSPPSPGTTYFNVGSQNSGSEPWGTVTFRTCCPFTLTFNVTCLRVVGNRATIAAEELPPNSGTRLWYIEDNPGAQDRLDMDGSPSPPPTVCPDPPPASHPDYEPAEGDVNVIDDYPPQPAD